MLKKYKFLIVITFLLLVSFLSTSYISYNIATTQTKNELKYKSLPLSSDNIYSEIQRDLLKPYLVSSLMAQDTFMINWILDGEKDMDRITSYLKSIKTKYNTSSSFLVSNITNKYYYPDGILKNINPNNPRDEWFYRLQQLEEDYEANIDIDLALNDSLTIFTNYKVKDTNNNTIAVTGVGLQTSHVKSLLENYKKKYNHHIYFLNKKKNIILSSKKENSVNKLKNIKFIKKAIQTYNKNNTKTIEYTYNHNKYILNIRFIEELNLYLIVEANESKLIEPYEESLYLNLYIFSSIILIIIFLIMLNIKYYNKKLEKLAKIDKLTSLVNRNYFDIRFNEIFNSSRNQEQNISLILFDIDNFKQINDEFGHLIGDQVLKIVSKIFVQTFRKEDITARWGGEEFISLLKNIDNETLFSLSEKLRQSISSNDELKTILNKSVTISLGIASKKDNETKEVFFARVDKNLYLAKKQGKNITIQ